MSTATTPLRLIESRSKRPLSYAHRWRRIMREWGITYRFTVGEDGIECVELDIPAGVADAMPFKDNAYLGRHVDRVLADGILRYRTLRVIDCDGLRPAAALAARRRASW